MAGKATSVYLTVSYKTTHKAALRKTFFRMADLNTFVSTPEFLEKYPSTEYYITKEVY